MLKNVSIAQTDYKGSGYVSQGFANIIKSNIFPNCNGARVASYGQINSLDGKSWIVPSESNFEQGPYLQDLSNPCKSINPKSVNDLNLSSLPITEIDKDGDIITGYIFADNYCELYINGVLVGVDPVPYTPFNSCVVKFKVSRPYTIAVRLIDWEENLGLGTENNNGSAYHSGDGGFIAQFSDGTVTDTTWKVQTFYIAPIGDLTQVVELPDGTRSTAGASTNPTCNSNCYAIHYDIPQNWFLKDFDDKLWVKPTLYTAEQVTNSSAYTNLASLWSNAKFIWPSNLILDNLVLARKVVGEINSVNESNEKLQIKAKLIDNNLNLVTNYPFNHSLVKLYDLLGNEIQTWDLTNSFESNLPIKSQLHKGIYMLTIKAQEEQIAVKLVCN